MRAYHGIRPRSVTVRHEEIAALLDAAPDFLRLWILFCSDLAIRSGTAARLGPYQYDASERMLRFTTKCEARLALPVTQEIADLIALCDLRDPTSFVRQLWMRKPRELGRRPKRDCTSADRLRILFRQLCKEQGIERRITPHDLRRTTAVGMLRLTHDVRDVQAILGHRSLQSTIWYLDHDLRPVPRHNLELIKRRITAAESEPRTA
ncbi:tyrosine-type recombinase/integrase [Occallatibacter savannae]|uniref:tyrosine-type recombinase/integrase n=1 Tax=Occallatibacter savannae TaxID=1002691 RepID=UPI000D68B41A|nr:tyrosine-type recombinase/integrase [Occallatibacter savannae]